MEVSGQVIKLSSQQQRVLLLLFKFRFISSHLLSEVMGISNPGCYKALESVVKLGFVNKVYESAYRIDRKPAYYCLNKQGVTIVRNLLGAKESVVHTLYKNDAASPEYIDHCLTAAKVYVSLMCALPDDANIYTTSEMRRLSALSFPKNKPDLYIRMPDGQEAIIVIMDGKQPYIARKRLDEIIQHSEDGEWDGDYPRIGFILGSVRDTRSFLYSAQRKLDAMGMDEEELFVLAAYLGELQDGTDRVWSNAFHPQSPARLLE